MEPLPRSNVSHASVAIGVVTALCALSTAVVGLRVWVRIRMTKQVLGLDDGLMIAAVVLNITETTLICRATKYGLGRHMEYVDPGNYVPFFKLAYGAILVYLSLIFLIKQSLILFYWRLSVSSYFHKWCLAYLATNTAVWLTFTLIGVFSCTPIAYFWDRAILGGRCVNLERVYLSNASLFVLMDVAALVLPVPCVWRLNMKLRKKIQLVVLFSVGLFVCVASFVRMTTMFNFNTETDATWAMIKSNIWSMIEVNIGIMTVSAPVVNPFFTRILWPAITGKSPNSSTSAGGGFGSYPQGALPRVGKPRGIGSDPYDITEPGAACGRLGKAEVSPGGPGITVTICTHVERYQMSPYNSRRPGDEGRSIASEDSGSEVTSSSRKELKKTEPWETDNGRGEDAV